MEDKAGNEASFWFGITMGAGPGSLDSFIGIREPPMTLPALLSVRFGLHAAVRPAGSGESTGEFPPLRAGADGRLQPARELHALSRVRPLPLEPSRLSSLPWPHGPSWLLDSTRHACAAGQKEEE